MENKLAPQPSNDVAGLLTKYKSQISVALPKQITMERFVRVCVTEVRRNPELGLCDQMSFLGAVMQAAQLGLEPGSGLGHAYLIPFNNRKKGIKEVVFIPGYRGLIDLARRSGNIESISARIVREKDVFKYTLGDEERIIHEPSPEAEAGSITYVYAVARLKGGGIQREVMSRAQIDEHKKRFSKGNPVWESDFDEMARKTVVRRICKYLPLSPELAQAITKDDEAQIGEGQANWAAIDVNYQPAPQKLDADKINAAQAASDSQFKTETEQKAERSHASAALMKAMDRVTKIGGNALQVLGTDDPGAFAREADIDDILSAVDRLDMWEKG